MAFPNFKFEIVLKCVLQMIFIYVKALYRIWINKFEIILCLFIGIQVFSNTCISCILQCYNFSVSIESKETPSDKSFSFGICLYEYACNLYQSAMQYFALSRNPIRIFFSFNHVDQMSYIHLFFFQMVCINVDIHDFDAFKRDHCKT